MAAFSGAQSIEEYLHLRRANSITKPTDIGALDHIVDPRVLELSANIKGTFKANGRGALMIDRADGSTAVVDCDDVPDWLSNSAAKARLIVNVWRDDNTSEIRIELLGAAPESSVTSYDKVAPPPASKKKDVAKPTTRPLPSRNITYRMMRDTHGAEAHYAPTYARFILGINRRLSADDAYAIAYFLIHDSLKYGVDARLIMAMVLAESSFNPYATSKDGAQGLGQLMPGTANGLGVGNAYDIEQNLDGMVRMVRGLLNTYKASTGDDAKMLYYTIAAYNAGAGAVAKYGGIPPYPETENYVQKVVYFYTRFTAGDKR